MVLGLAYTTHVQQRQALLSSNFSGRPRPIQLSLSTRQSPSLALRVAQSFDTQPAIATVPEPVDERIEAEQAAEPIVEEEHPQLQTPVPSDVLSEFEHKVWLVMDECHSVVGVLQPQDHATARCWDSALHVGPGGTDTEIADPF